MWNEILPVAELVKPLNAINVKCLDMNEDLEKCGINEGDDLYLYYLVYIFLVFMYIVF